MVVPFSFTFKSPALHRYATASSLSKLSEFLILQFQVKCCKMHSVFKILPKSYMLDIFLISSVYYKCSYDFIVSKSINSPNLYINWVKIWYPGYQNKNLNLCMLNSFKSFCHTLIISLVKNSICACYCKKIKTSFARIK